MMNQVQQNKSIMFSGVQPTGNLHLGNYLGAIKQWVSSYQNYDAIFCVVDMHAITVPQDPEKLKQQVRETAATYIACGIEPEKAIIYPQSAVSGHAELAWILGCLTPIGWLNRMTQFKEKAGKNRDNASLGLYGYPALMAADILLFHATHVPVGDDQKQHLELTRDIAGAFNRRYFDNDNNGEEGYFTMPEPIIMQQAARIMSLRDGSNKMSKSDMSENSRIHLADNADVIAKKVRKAKTDHIEGMSYNREERPEASNLLEIYAALNNQDIKNVAEEFSGYGFAGFKEILAESLIEQIIPIGKKISDIMDDRAELDRVIAIGAEKAGQRAMQTIKKVKEIVGFI